MLSVIIGMVIGGVTVYTVDTLSKILSRLAKLEARPYQPPYYNRTNFSDYMLRRERDNWREKYETLANDVKEKFGYVAIHDEEDENDE